MGKRQRPKNRKHLKIPQGGGGRDEKIGAAAGSGCRLIACGRISPKGRETYVTFQSVSDIGQAAVRRVFSSTARAEEIANA